MPIYVYQCSACEVKIEKLQKISDPPPEICEACGQKGALVKKISPASFDLKGGGWAKDGYS